MNSPTAVVMWLDDGREIEEMFPSRFQAELFLAMLPSLVLPGEVRVLEAILSPLAILSPRPGMGQGEVGCE